jgi:hypothetical protein
MRAVSLAPAAVVVVALAALAGVAELGHPGAAGTARAGGVTRQVTVTSAQRACPPALGGGSGTVALIAGAPGPASPGSASPGSASPGSASTGGGQLQLTSLPPTGVSLRAASPIRRQDSGVLSVLNVPAVKPTGKGNATAAGWSVSASGAMAPAMEAEVAAGSGLGAVRCGEPGSDTWFVGPGQRNGAAQIQVDMMNVDPQAASVDLSVITDAGQAQSSNDTGITVPPDQTVTQSVSSMASGSSVVAIEVHTSIGRVAADVSEGPAHGSTTSWLPSSATPATELVIPGVPPASQAAGLYLAVPGSASAKVSVLAVTPQGHYQPFGSQSIDLPGQSASYVPLTPLGGTAAALEIVSSVPVTASVLVPGSGVGAVTAASAPISEQAVVAGNTSGSGTAATVVLSATKTAARVRLTEIAPAASGGKPAASNPAASQVVSVRAGHTLVTSVQAPAAANHKPASFALVITPLAGSGPVYAARVETRSSTVTSIIPAASALSTIALPPTRDSYDAISPG